MTAGAARLIPVLCLGVLPAGAQEVTFRANARLVEVHATVLDEKGRYIDDLELADFRVAEDGRQQEIVAFEDLGTELSCALLLDTTGSMAGSLPAAKRGVLLLLDELRGSDAVAVYGFNNSVTRLVDFTLDKSAAKQAVLRTRPYGRTALFDAIAEVARAFARRSGKKAIVVFTDGADNASALNMDLAVGRARRIGVPVYTIAQGEALSSKRLLEQLRKMAGLSGGLLCEARNAAQIGECFEQISNDLRHTYMLAYKPPAGGPGWRSIQVRVDGSPQYRVRAKQGYLPE